jgi:nucleoside-triphosphatase THEP1
MKEIIHDIGIDDPLINMRQDSLNRVNFARKIYKIINGTPLDTHIRIGIYGSWGSGKTTVLNFIKELCEKSGHPTAFFKPWQFHNREEAWSGFIISLDRGIANWKKQLIGAFKRKKIIKSLSEKARKLAEITDTKIGRIIGELIIAPLEGRLEQTKENVNKELENTLKDKRLYVFVDDLDRAEPEIVYDFLMLLNEVVDLTHCIYIIAIDADTISQVLKSKLHYESPKDREFLGKIINWSFELPEPSLFDWKMMMGNEVRRLDKNIDRKALGEITDLLPKNARKFKHFLRYISGLHKGFLNRFDKDELNWKILYLAQLLRAEFPQAFKEIMQDNDFLEDIASGILTDRAYEVNKKAFGAKGEEKEEKWLIRLKDRLGKLSDVSNNHFIEIYSALRDSGGLMSLEQLRNHMLVIEDPELFTWKEYRNFKNTLLKLKDNEIIKRLKGFVSNKKKEHEIERVREFIRMLLRERETCLGRVADLHTEEEMKAVIKNDIQGVMKIGFLLAEIDEIFNGINPLFNKNIFKEWFVFLSKWAHFQNQDIYKDLRNEEKKLIIKIANKIKPQASSILDALREFHDPFLQNEKAFADTRKEVEKILQGALVSELINRFKINDGIRELWGKNDYIAEKKLLFYKDSLFHDDKVYKELKTVAEKAKNSIVIQNNFIEYARMLFHASVSVVEWTNSNETNELLKKSEFLTIIWNAVISQPLNRRLVGSFEEYRGIIKKDILKDDNALPIPKWWENLIADIKQPENSHES